MSMMSKKKRRHASEKLVVGDGYRAKNSELARDGVPFARAGNINNGFAVFSSTPYFGHVGWHSIGGTSAGAPQWAALIAIANSMRTQESKDPLTGQDVNTALYEAAGNSYDQNFNDIRAGTSNKCGALCSAGPGYDFVTGLGSPQAKSLIKALVDYDN